MTKRQGGERPLRIMCDFWYVSELPLPCDMLDDRSAQSQHYGLKERLRRAWKLARISGDYDLVVPNWFEYGMFYCVLAALMGRRNIVLLEFIDNRLQRRPWLIRTAYAVAATAVVGPALRRITCAMQTMTSHEGDAVAARYGLDRSRIRAIPWPLWGTQRDIMPELRVPRRAPYVFSSGRAACDWETLFAAARGSDWPLLVICSGADADRVAALNADGRAEVMVDIPLVEHDRLLMGATVCAIVLFEEQKSSGQIRLGGAIEMGVPAVVSDIVGLRDYLEDGVTGVAVPAGDAASLRRAIDRLMADDGARADLTTAARNAVSHYSRADYFVALATLLKDAGRRLIA